MTMARGMADGMCIGMTTFRTMVRATDGAWGAAISTATESGPACRCAAPQHAGRPMARRAGQR